MLFISKMPINDKGLLSLPIKYANAAASLRSLMLVICQPQNFILIMMCINLCLYQQFPLENGVLQVKHMLPVELFWAALSIECYLDNK